MYSNVIVALEGVVHTGKTTLLHGVKLRMGERICCIDEYSTYKGRVRFPDFPTTSEEALGANEFFVRLEEKRFADVSEPGIVLLDRSLLSVLAYHYATEKVTDGRVSCFEQSLLFFRENFSCWLPRLVIRLNISPEVFRKRHAEDSGLYKPVLLDEAFNRNLVLFYDNLGTYFPEIKVHKIDAVKSKVIVLRRTLNILSAI